MRTPIVAGNWKMNKLIDDAVDLASAVAEGASDLTGVEVIVGPTAACLASVADALDGSEVGMAAQNMHWAESGAYTGELSAGMLLDAGCTHVIVGHSERREYFGETDEGVNHKAEVALDGGLTPIICVGESLEERKAGRTVDKVSFQVRAALAGLDVASVESVVLAYEPLWAIGTGETATPKQAQEVHLAIRSLIGELYGEGAAQSLRILYGGSVKPHNIEELIQQPDLDGALVGGASLDAGSFLSIARTAATKNV
ncbi:MAG: triose-phosphate isomerase [Myxococcota bacterium]